MDPSSGSGSGSSHGSNNISNSNSNDSRPSFSRSFSSHSHSQSHSTISDQSHFHNSSQFESVLSLSRSLSDSHSLSLPHSEGQSDPELDIDLVLLRNHIQPQVLRPPRAQQQQPLQTLLVQPQPPEQQQQHEQQQQPPAAPAPAPARRTRFAEADEWTEIPPVFRPAQAVAQRLMQQQFQQHQQQQLQEEGDHDNDNNGPNRNNGRAGAGADAGPAGAAAPMGGGIFFQLNLEHGQALQHWNDNNQHNGHNNVDNHPQGGDIDANGAHHDDHIHENENQDPNGPLDINRHPDPADPTTCPLDNQAQVDAAVARLGGISSDDDDDEGDRDGDGTGSFAGVDSLSNYTYTDSDYYGSTLRDIESDPDIDQFGSYSSGSSFEEESEHRDSSHAHPTIPPLVHSSTVPPRPDTMTSHPPHTPPFRHLSVDGATTTTSVLPNFPSLPSIDPPHHNLEPNTSPPSPRNTTLRPPLKPLFPAALSSTLQSNAIPPTTTPTTTTTTTTPTPTPGPRQKHGLVHVTRPTSKSESDDDSDQFYHARDPNRDRARHHHHHHDNKHHKTRNTRNDRNTRNGLQFDSDNDMMHDHEHDHDDDTNNNNNHDHGDTLTVQSSKSKKVRPFPRSKKDGQNRGDIKATAMTTTTTTTNNNNDLTPAPLDDKGSGYSRRSVRILEDPADISLRGPTTQAPTRPLPHVHHSPSLQPKQLSARHSSRVARFGSSNNNTGLKVAFVSDSDSSTPPSSPISLPSHSVFDFDESMTTASNQTPGQSLTMDLSDEQQQEQQQQEHQQQQQQQSLQGQRHLSNSNTPNQDHREHNSNINPNANLPRPHHNNNRYSPSNAFLTSDDGSDDNGPSDNNDSDVDEDADGLSDYSYDLSATMSTTLSHRSNRSHHSQRSGSSLYSHTHSSSTLSKGSSHRSKGSKKQKATKSHKSSEKSTHPSSHEPSGLRSSNSTGYGSRGTLSSLSFASSLNVAGPKPEGNPVLQGYVSFSKVHRYYVPKHHLDVLVTTSNHNGAAFTAFRTATDSDPFSHLLDDVPEAEIGIGASASTTGATMGMNEHSLRSTGQRNNDRHDHHRHQDEHSFRYHRNYDHDQHDQHVHVHHSSTLSSTVDSPSPSPSTAPFETTLTFHPLLTSPTGSTHGAMAVHKQSSFKHSSSKQKQTKHHPLSNHSPPFYPTKLPPNDMPSSLHTATHFFGHSPASPSSPPANASETGLAALPALTSLTDHNGSILASNHRDHYNTTNHITTTTSTPTMITITTGITTSPPSPLTSPFQPINWTPVAHSSTLPTTNTPPTPNQVRFTNEFNKHYHLSDHPGPEAGPDRDQNHAQTAPQTTTSAIFSDSFRSFPQPTSLHHPTPAPTSVSVLTSAPTAHRLPDCQSQPPSNPRSPSDSFHHQSTTSITQHTATPTGTQIPPPAPFKSVKSVSRVRFFDPSSEDDFDSQDDSDSLTSDVSNPDIHAHPFDGSAYNHSDFGNGGGGDGGDSNPDSTDQIEINLSVVDAAATADGALSHSAALSRASHNQIHNHTRANQSPRWAQSSYRSGNFAPTSRGADAGASGRTTTSTSTQGKQRHLAHNQHVHLGSGSSPHATNSPFLSATAVHPHTQSSILLPTSTTPSPSNHHDLDLTLPPTTAITTTTKANQTTMGTAAPTVTPSAVSAVSFHFDPRQHALPHPHPLQHQATALSSRTNRSHVLVTTAPTTALSMTMSTSNPHPLPQQLSLTSSTTPSAPPSSSLSFSLRNSLTPVTSTPTALPYSTTTHPSHRNNINTAPHSHHRPTYRLRGGIRRYYSHELKLHLYTLLIALLEYRLEHLDLSLCIQAMLHHYPTLFMDQAAFECVEAGNVLPSVPAYPFPTLSHPPTTSSLPPFPLLSHPASFHPHPFATPPTRLEITTDTPLQFPTLFHYALSNPIITQGPQIESIFALLYPKYTVLASILPLLPLAGSATSTPSTALQTLHSTSPPQTSPAQSALSHFFELHLLTQPPSTPPYPGPAPPVHHNDRQPKSQTLLHVTPDPNTYPITRPSDIFYLRDEEEMTILHHLCKKEFDHRWRSARTMVPPASHLCLEHLLESYVQLALHASDGLHEELTLSPPDHLANPTTAATSTATSRKKIPFPANARYSALPRTLIKETKGL